MNAPIAFAATHISIPADSLRRALALVRPALRKQPMPPTIVIHDAFPPVLSATTADSNTARAQTLAAIKEWVKWQEQTP